MFTRTGRAGLISALIAAISIGLFQIPVTAYSQEEPIPIVIQVSPSTLNIQNQGEWVTIHTDIAYNYVMGASVILNDIPIAWWKSDSQGNFVAKFVILEVKELVTGLGIELPAQLDLTLWGTTYSGETFEGTQTITVIDVVPVGTGKK